MVSIKWKILRFDDRFSKTNYEKIHICVVLYYISLTRAVDKFPIKNFVNAKNRTMDSCTLKVLLTMNYASPHSGQKH